MILSSTDVVVEFDPIAYDVVESGVVRFMVVVRTVSQRQITVFFDTNEGSATCKFPCIPVAWQQMMLSHYSFIND